MSDSDLLDDFLAVSAALTGFSVAQLQGTGMATTYLDELVADRGRRAHDRPHPRWHASPCAGPMPSTTSSACG